MRLVTAREMQAIDRAAIDGGHVPSLELMENAGLAVARFVLKHSRDDAPIHIVCGKGNNGGDGLVAARHLAAHGRTVRVALSHAADDLSSDAQANYARLQETSADVQVLPSSIEDPGPVESAA